MIKPEDYRNGVLEALELASSAEAQRDYQAKVPIAQVVAEVFCWWEDIYHPEVPVTGVAFTQEELLAMAEYEITLNQVAADTKTNRLEEFHASRGFQVLSEAAKTTLKVLKGNDHVADLPPAAAAERLNIDLVMKNMDSQEGTGRNNVDRIWLTAFFAHGVLFVASNSTRVLAPDFFFRVQGYIKWLLLSVFLGCVLYAIRRNPGRLLSGLAQVLLGAFLANVLSLFAIIVIKALGG